MNNFNLKKYLSEGKLLKEYDDAWVEKYLSQNGIRHVSYKSGKGVLMKDEDWAQHKGKYTINNGRIGYVKDDGSLHSVGLASSVGENEAIMKYMNDNYDSDGGVPVVSESLKESGKRMKISRQAAELVDGFELEDLERNLENIYGEMEQEAEPEGGPIADQYADEIHHHEQAIRFIKNKGKEKAQLTYDQAIGRISRDDFEKSSKFDRNLEEASADFSIDTYKMADSFTPQELKRYKADGKISGEVYNGAIEIQRSWKQSHPTMRIGGGPYKKEILGKLNEDVGKELEDRNDALYHLVPGDGKADTIEGEMLRAINRIVYRYYNDGDEYLTGYGTETVGPAHAFLVDSNNPKKAALSQIFSTGINYETTIKDALELILDYIESRNGDYTKNTLGNMFDYKSHYEDEEEYEEDEYYDDYDEDEEDY